MKWSTKIQFGFTVALWFCIMSCAYIRTPGILSPVLFVIALVVFAVTILHYLDGPKRDKWRVMYDGNWMCVYSEDGRKLALQIQDRNFGLRLTELLNKYEN